jgi:hypothetical protein
MKRLFWAVNCKKNIFAVEEGATVGAYSSCSSNAGLRCSLSYFAIVQGLPIRATTVQLFQSVNGFRGGDISILKARCSVANKELAKQKFLANIYRSLPWCRWLRHIYVVCATIYEKTIFGLPRQFLVFYISVPSVYPIVLFSAACSLVNFSSPQLPIFFICRIFAYKQRTSSCLTGTCHGGGHWFDSRGWLKETFFSHSLGGK